MYAGNKRAGKEAFVIVQDIMRKGEEYKSRLVAIQDKILKNPGQEDFIIELYDINTKRYKKDRI